MKKDLYRTLPTELADIIYYYVEHYPDIDDDDAAREEMIESLDREDISFEAALKWLQHDSENRFKYIIYAYEEFDYAGAISNAVEDKWNMYSHTDRVKEERKKFKNGAFLRDIACVGCSEWIREQIYELIRENKEAGQKSESYETVEKEEKIAVWLMRHLPTADQIAYFENHGYILKTLVDYANGNDNVFNFANGKQAFELALSVASLYKDGAYPSVIAGVVPVQMMQAFLQEADAMDIPLIRPVMIVKTRTSNEDVKPVYEWSGEFERVESVTIKSSKWEADTL